MQVPLQRETVTGFITGTVKKPVFTTKPIVAIVALPPLPPQLVQLGKWLKAYYPAPLGMVAQQLTPTITKIAPYKPHASQPDISKLPTLTDEQQAAAANIVNPDTYILHGKTGSGKTRLYIELTLTTLTAGRSAIILTPEISLTSQITDRFRQVFGDRVMLLHSQLTPVEKRTAWQQIVQADEPLIVIGPRSALFSPLKNVGLIVMDEAHEPAYKQEQAPHYQTGRVAAKLRELHDAILVLGSATPAIGDYYLAEQRQKSIVTMQSLAINDEQPITTTIIDLKDHSLFPKSHYLSQPLTEAIHQALTNGEQTLLYLNRRGTARIIICEDCGWQAMCPHCDIPLTYHGDAHELRCHVCNYRDTPPTICPDCKHPSVVYKSIGTKAVVDEVQKLFPGARVQRFDTDNTKAERFEQHYEAVTRGDVDILVGTQLLAKGLDLPRLSVLGVLMADTSLQMPDYTATERTYQLLSQVLGRIGRGHRAGRAFVQTYQPNNPVIQAAVTNDWDGFYKNEMSERKQFKFPPFYYILKLSVRRASASAAAKAAQTFADSLSSRSIIIEGPAPSLHEKIAGKYQYQLIIKSTQRSELIKIIANLPANWSYDIDPADLL